MRPALPYIGHACSQAPYIERAVPRTSARWSRRLFDPAAQAVAGDALLPGHLLEFDVSYGFRDIVADRFDAGVRLGESIDKDMVALPISPKLRMAAVASPFYFERHSASTVPDDLTRHNCINVRFPSSGGLYVWELGRGRKVNVRADGQTTFNSTPNLVHAALDGLGIAFLPEDEFAQHIQEGGLVRVLQGLHLYFRSRRQHSPAFSLVMETLRV